MQRHRERKTGCQVAVFFGVLSWNYGNVNKDTQLHDTRPENYSPMILEEKNVGKKL